MLIEKVEKFENKKGHLPKDISELGISELEDSPAFYQLKSDSSYIVWYGLGVGESKVYKSENKRWTEEG